MSHLVKFPAKNLPMEFPDKLEVILKTIEELSKEPELTVDTETTGLFWSESGFRVFYITFCDGKRGVGLTFPKQGGPIWRALKEKIFENAFQRHIYQNAKFDLLGLRTQGIEDLGEVHDTMILKAIQDERDSKHLEAMAKQYLEEGVTKMTGPIEAWFKENNVKKDERRYDKIPIGILGPYAIQDTIVTWWLWKGLYPLIQENENWKKCYEVVELPCLRALVDVETVGYAIDTAMLKALEPELEAQIMGLESEMRKLILRVAPTEGSLPAQDVAWADAFNFQSPDQLVHLFLDKFKVPRNALGTTETGKPSCDWYSMERIKILSKDETGQHWAASTFAAILQGFTDKSKLLETFVRGVDKRAVDGAVHGQFNQVGARTGRMSSSNPNMQNMPAEGPIREAFICRPGMVNFFWDWSQIEMRILAHYCDDTTMVEAIQAGEDLHTATAAELFDKMPTEVTKEDRAIAKVINFSICYGAGQARVAQQIGWELPRAKELLLRYNAKFPGVRDFRDRASRVVKQRGWVKTLWGRYRHIEADKAYIAVNSIVQGTATGDMVKLALARVWAHLKKRGAGNIISVVHDEIAVQLPKENYKFIVPEITEIMETWPEVRVPIKVDVSFTETNWASKKPYEVLQKA